MLVDFWLENFKLQVGARSGQLHLDMEGMSIVSVYDSAPRHDHFPGEPPVKRRRVVSGHFALRGESPPAPGDDFRMDVDQPLDFAMSFGDFRTCQHLTDKMIHTQQLVGDTGEMNFDSRMRSSEVRCRRL